MPDIQKVAILKSRLYKGGVAQVLGHLIFILNSRGIIPDILTLRADLTKNDFDKLYKLKIDFKVKFIGPDLKIPYEWHFLYFNILSRGYAKKYDLFINSNNTSFLSPHSINTITYIHFPRKYRVLSDSSSIHFPEKKDKSPLDIKNDPFYLAKFLYRFNHKFGKKEIVIGNSDFTASIIKKSYFRYQNKIEVLFPPVDVEHSLNKNKVIQVVTLGRISTEKRQLEQIEIAKKLPDINFIILGFTNYGKYYQKCKELIEDSRTENVKLLVNQSFAEINKTLADSLIFLHNVRNEPFGIGIVQAAAAGCIPVVHGSGGAKEIVNNESLFFNNSDEAVHIINKIKKGEINFTFTNRYSSEEFKSKFIRIYNSIQE